MFYMKTRVSPKKSPVIFIHNYFIFVTFLLNLYISLISLRFQVQYVDMFEFDF